MLCPSSPLQRARCVVETRSNKSLAIPLPASHIQRTESEVQLHNETAVAEYRDQCMSNRLIMGIRNRQQQCNMLELSSNNCGSPDTSEFMEETERSIGNIVSTRNQPAHFFQDVEKVIPSGSGDLQIFQPSNTFNTSSQILRRQSRDFEDR